MNIQITRPVLQTAITVTPDQANAWIGALAALHDELGARLAKLPEARQFEDNHPEVVKLFGDMRLIAGAVQVLQKLLRGKVELDLSSKAVDEAATLQRTNEASAFNHPDPGTPSWLHADDVEEYYWRMGL